MVDKMFLVDVYKGFKDFSSKNNLVLSSLFILTLIYPLFILSVKHWSSGIYSLLCLISIGYLFKKSNFIFTREVKIYSWIVFLFFVSILISSTLNDWTINSYKRLGMEMKILIFIPFLLLLSQYSDIRKWFVYSIPFSGIILGMHALIEILIFDEPFANSSYGKIITGDVAGLLFGLSGVILIYSKDSWLKRVSLVAAVLTAIACILSTSRNGWLVLLFNSVFLLFLSYNHNKKSTLLLVITLSLSVFVAGGILDINKGFEKAVSEYKDYVSNTGNHKKSIVTSSVGIRLEQWRIALIAFPEKPFFGVGPGNSSIVINKYIEMGIAHPDLYHPKAETNMGHVHNQFIDTLLVQGVFGFVLLLLILFYPAGLFIKHYKKNELYANMGLVLIISYVISSITEMPFVSDNYVSIFFMFMAVFLLNTLDDKTDYNLFRKNY